MPELLLIVLLALGAANLLLMIALLRRRPVDKSVELDARLLLLEKGQERLEHLIKDEIGRNRDETSSSAKQAREELAASLKSFSEATSSRLTETTNAQKNQLDLFSNQLSGLSQTTEQRLDRMRNTIEESLRKLQEDNATKLDQMRVVVDEKLHQTLEQRLGHSFNMVVERLELVHRGLGEMQQLASGVGDLKRVLSNVKTRGGWSEVQLGNLLDQILANDQFERNVVTKRGSSERVEFALKLPGQASGDGSEVFLPIDAKFPREAYERILDAQEQANAVAVEEASRQLDRTIKEMARSINEKYLDPPNTTDFGIMYLPTEGLFAEVVRRPGICEFLQREYRVTVAGPTTLATLLNCLHMGFRTLAIEKRASEVWNLLSAVKTEFAKFGDVLEKTQKKLQEASNTIEDAAKKSRTIERKLTDVQQLPQASAEGLFRDRQEGLFSAAEALLPAKDEE